MRFGLINLDIVMRMSDGGIEATRKVLSLSTG